MSWLGDALGSLARQVAGGPSNGNQGEAAQDPERELGTVHGAAAGRGAATGDTTLVLDQATASEAENAARAEFVAACGAGDVASARRILSSQGQRVDSKTFYDALVGAISAGRTDAVQYLVNLRNDFAAMALVTASRGGQEDIVRLLIARDYQFGDQLDVALQGASAKGHLVVVQLLLAAGAGTNSWMAAEGFVTACARGHLEVANCLIASGMNVNRLHGAALRRASFRGHVPVVRRLMEAGAEYADLLIDACWLGKTGTVQALIEAGADVTVPHNEAVQAASESNRVAILESLIAAGADVHASNDAAIITAAREEAFEAVKYLLTVATYRAEVLFEVMLLTDYRTPDDTVARDVVELILKAGGDPMRVPDTYTFRPDIMPFLTKGQFHKLPVHAKKMWIDTNIRYRRRLVQALERARNNLDRPPNVQLGTANPTREQMIAFLLEGGKRFARDYWIGGLPLFHKGADLGALPDEFKETERSSTRAPAVYHKHTPLEQACIAEDIVSVQRLLNEGADIHAHDDLALVLASARGNAEIVSLLLRAGARVHARNDAALRVASQRGHREVLARLLDGGADGPQVLRQYVELMRMAETLPYAGL